MRSCLFAAALALLALQPAPLQAQPDSPPSEPLRGGGMSAYPGYPSLRDPIQANGPALKLGDVFRIEGPDAEREIASAPPRGQSALYSTSFLAAAAQAAGYAWSPPVGFTQVLVHGPDADRSALQQAPDRRKRGETLIRRGDLVTLTYRTGALQLTARARATANAAEGEAIRLVNIDSDRTVEAVVTGPGQASASPP